MSGHPFAMPALPQLPIAGSDQTFPVRQIYCVGRNYADHAREMGHDPDREPPFFFMKGTFAIAQDGEDIAYPPRCENLHYEGELVVALGGRGRDLTPTQAAAAVFGHAVGNDLTRRDLQDEAKALRRPWALSKGFDGAAVIGPVHPATAPLTHGAIRSHVNGELRQSADLSMMIWPIADLVAELSTYVALAAGDLIMTGTPAGVGQLTRGDEVTVEIEPLGTISSRIV